MCNNYGKPGNEATNCVAPCSLKITVLSRASAHGRSHLKHQILGGGGYTEKVLKWFDYLQARAHPGCEVGSHGAESTCIVGSFVLRRGQSDSGEGCYKADRLIALLLSFRSVQSSPAVRDFHAARNTANQAMDRCVRT